MKMKYLAALLGGLLATGVALAEDDYSLTTSDNLIGNYKFYDSGWNDTTGYKYSNTYNWSYDNTTQKVLNTFQDSLGKWYAKTEFTSSNSYDYDVTAFTSTDRAFTFNIIGSWQGGEATSTTASAASQIATGDQFIDLTLTTSGEFTYSFYSSGTYGSKTARGGLTQKVTPAVGVLVDGTPSNINSWDSGSNSWHSSTYEVAVKVSNSFEAIVEATDGGSIMNYGLLLQKNLVLGETLTEHYSYANRTWIQNMEMTAPVPEPESYAMLLAGLSLMGIVARRRRIMKA